MGRKIVSKKSIENTVEKTIYSKIIGYFLLGFFFAFPWIICAVSRKINAEEESVYIHKIEEIIDTCLFSKMYVLLGFAIVMLILIGFHIYANRKRLFRKNMADSTISVKDVIYAGTAIFIVLAVLSAALSEYKMVSLWGSYNNPEGLFVILAYIVLAAAAYISFQNEKIWNGFKYVIMALALVAIVLSLVEFFYKPITQIMYPEGWRTDYKNMVSLTFYNSGYYGGFVILIFPVVMELLLNSKKVYEIILLSFEFVGMLLCVLLSKSTGAFLVVIFEILAMGIYELWISIKYKKCIFKWVIKLICTVGMLLILGGIDLISGGKITNQLHDTASNETEAIHSENYVTITDIEVSGNVINIVSKNKDNIEKTLMVQLNDTQIAFDDKETSQIVEMTQEDGLIYFHGDYEGICARMENNALTFDYGYKGDVRFYIHENAFYPMLSDGSIVGDITGSGLKGGDFIHTATGRGYIWMNTLPILKRSVIIGQGPATFGLCFKQFDFVGLLNSQGTVDLFIDKPHNMYLQTVEQTGVISAVIMVILLALLLWNGKSFAGLIISVSGFMILGIVNDSCITVNPLFWIMAGIIFARISVKELKSE